MRLKCNRNVLDVNTGFEILFRKNDYFCRKDSIMSVERKCGNCQTWDIDKDYCTECNVIISAELKDKLAYEQKEKELRNAPKEKFEIFLEKWKSSSNYILKGLYYICYSIAFIFFSIAGFLAYLAAASNG